MKDRSGLWLIAGVILFVAAMAVAHYYQHPLCGQSCQPADTAGPDNFELRDFPFEKEWI